MPNKRGLSTIAYILLTVIIAVLSFSILIYFVLTADTGEFTVDEICKLSVLTRATTPDLPFDIKQKIPLKCTTKKVCITGNSGFLKKGRCEQFAGEEEISRVDLPREDITGAANLIEKTVAEKMLECWKMMGEGKIDLVGEPGTFSDAEPVCLICSRIAIDEDFVYSSDIERKEFSEGFEKVMSEVDINEYLISKQAPESKKTFLQVFTDDSVRAYGSFQGDIEGSKTERKTTEMAVLFSQINTDKDFSEAFQDTAVIGGGIVVAGNGILGTVKTLFRNPIFFLGELAGIGIASTIAGFQAEDNQAISAAYCGDFSSSGSKDKGNLAKGCSVVTVVDYSDVSNINRICKGGIIGSP